MTDAALEERAKQNSQGIPTDKKFRLGQVVAAFVPDWIKWVRASVKRIEENGDFCVWAIDYGVPLVLGPENIVYIPLSFAGKNTKHSLIHIGGIENCYPAEISYDIDTNSSVKEKLSNWTVPAIELFQKLINGAVKLSFEHVFVSNAADQKPRHFGRLMMLRPDGLVVNVVKCLLEMNMAILADDFQGNLQYLDTLKQPIHLSPTGKMLGMKMIVAPIVTVNEKPDLLDKDYFDDEVIDEEAGDTLTVEDNAFFDESVSMFGLKPAGPVKSYSKSGFGKRLGAPAAAAVASSATATSQPMRVENIPTDATEKKAVNEKMHDNLEHKSGSGSHLSNSSRKSNKNSKQLQNDPQNPNAVRNHNGRAQNFERNQQQQNQRANRQNQPNQRNNNPNQHHSSQQKGANNQRNRRNKGWHKAQDSSNMFGDPDFEAAFHRPQKLASIPEMAPTPNVGPPGKMHFQRANNGPMSDGSMRFHPSQNSVPHPLNGSPNFAYPQHMNMPRYPMNYPPPGPFNPSGHRGPPHLNHPPYYLNSPGNHANNNRGPPIDNKNNQFNRYPPNNFGRNNNRNDALNKDVKQNVNDEQTKEVIPSIKKLTGVAAIVAEDGNSANNKENQPISENEPNQPIVKVEKVDAIVEKELNQPIVKEEMVDPIKDMANIKEEKQAHFATSNEPGPEAVAGDKEN